MKIPDPQATVKFAIAQGWAKPPAHAPDTERLLEQKKRACGRRSMYRRRAKEKEKLLPITADAIPHYYDP